ncbi:uncharacterized protein NECHADRAFT_77126 [Fusarium vanettenii 77-13-4]|uniref:beta-glucosidase n=1 Tax=Fusarium vanettenii (strain ATCC MYA-4622 / CBS 123669 / FGSC 9596 / NRRL 45880 / 77-13-4) TaxID=660122 RepID=C7ZCP8_FUSV7|nr:uncharacterized protein NECHADRAFT_77126 [Fusarium vanettenii 77-13-4]EEU38300.1 hypothetical protein NECHADRAFT_77126 [Fusarium vanettenii 77-13-4]
MTDTKQCECPRTSSVRGFNFGNLKSLALGSYSVRTPGKLHLVLHYSNSFAKNTKWPEIWPHERLLDSATLLKVVTLAHSALGATSSTRAFVCFRPHSDGPAGYSRSDGVSVFPSGITVAATWDRDLMYKRGVALGEEFKAKGAHVHFGWENFGPDPYLAGAAMSASVLGIQSVGVQACSKHYISNEQETQRTSSIQGNNTVIDAISSNIDGRTLHDLDLWPFANAVKAGTACIMCSYNRVNVNYSCANSELMAILKEELAFLGYVVSDCGASFSVYQYGHKSELLLNFPKVPARDVRGNHATLIRQPGAAGPTTGFMYLDYGQNPKGFETGTVDIGGGSDTVRRTNLITPLDAVRKHAEMMNGRVQVLLDNEDLRQGVQTLWLLYLGQESSRCPGQTTRTSQPSSRRITLAKKRNSIADVLWGRAEPSGCLLYTIPKNLADHGKPIVNLSQPVVDPDAWRSDFDERQMIDCRHFDTDGIEPLFEFGFGLSYTQFNMSSSLTVHVSPGLSFHADESKGVAPGGLKDLWTPVAEVIIGIANVGDSAGTAVPQLYVSLPADKTRADVMQMITPCRRYPDAAHMHKLLFGELHGALGFYLSIHLA